MDKLDAVLEIDSRLQKIFLRSHLPLMSVSLQTEIGPQFLNFTRAEWARCHSRMERCKLVASRIAAGVA